MNNNLPMKVTLDIQPKDMRDVMRFAGEKRKDAAVLKFLASSLQLSRRREVLEKFMTGEWGTEGASGSDKKAQWAATP